MRAIATLLTIGVLAWAMPNHALAQDPPPNDHCWEITPQALAVGSSLVFLGNNENATFEGDNEEGHGLYNFNVPVVWEAFTTTTCANVEIAFCGSPTAFGGDFWDLVTPDCPANQIIVAASYHYDECDDGQPNMHFNELPAGTWYYPVWAKADGPQGDYVLTVTATACAGAGPEADAGPDQFFCGPVTSTTMAANVPDGAATGVWTVIQGSFIIDDPSNPNTLFNGLGVGENIAQWTVDDGAGATASDQVSIFVYDANNPEADAGEDQDGLCGTGTVLHASQVTFPAEGLWIVVEGAGTFADPHDPDTEVTGLAEGLNVFEWSVDNGPCGSSSSVVAIRVAQSPVADAGEDQDVCSSNESVFLNATDAIPPAVGTWTVMEGSATIADVNDPHTQITDFSPGLIVFEWTVQETGDCGTLSASDAVRFTVYDANQPGANAGVEQTIQLPQTSATLTANEVSAPAVGTWMVESGSGVFADVHDPNTEVTDLSVGVNIFTWTVDNGPCGTSQDQVTITVEESGDETPDLTVPGSLLFTGNNSDATDDQVPGIVAVWHGFNLTACADVVLDYCNTEGFTVFSTYIYKDEPEGEAIMAASMSTCPGFAGIRGFTNVQPGVYWFPVLMDPEEASGDYVVEVIATDCAVVPGPANDDCDAAELIEPEGAGPVYTTMVEGDLTMSIGQEPAPACIDGEENDWQDLWYRIENESNDIITLQVGTAEDAKVGIEVFRECGGESIACAVDDAPIQLSEYPAGTFFIRVFTYGDEGSMAGTFELNVAVDRTTGIDAANLNGITVHPNPNTGDFMLVAPFSASEALVIVRDMTGRTVYSGRTILTQGAAHQFVLANLLQPGNYIMELSTEEQKAVARLVVN